MQVNENGVISFDRPWRYSLPDRFPTDFYWTRQGLAVAPFWSDNDIRREGRVRYATYSITERRTNQQGATLMSDVNDYIRELQEEGEERFSGKWLLVVHWDHVHPSPHGQDDHNGIPEDELEKVVKKLMIILQGLSERSKLSPCMVCNILHRGCSVNHLASSPGLLPPFGGLYRVYHFAH